MKIAPFYDSMKEIIKGEDLLNMEYLDILDEYGNKTGKIKDRKQIHIDGDWHRVAFIFVVNSKGEIILQKRSKEKETNPNKWTASASGYLSAGDKEIEGALRELEEEIGIKSNEEELKYLFTVKEKYKNEKENLNINHFSDVYLLFKDIKIEDLTLQKEEVSEAKYISYKEFEKIIKEENVVRHDEIYEGVLKVLHEKFD